MIRPGLSGKAELGTGARDGRRDNGSGPPAGPPIRVLYIAGIGRSGSTLLNRTLGATPGFFAGGELMHFFGRGVRDNELCSCGSPFRDCEIWGDVVAALGSDATPSRATEVDPFRHAITEGKHLLTMLLSPWKPASLRPRLATYERTVVQVYRAVQGVTGCRVLVDSSKNLSYARILQRIPEFRVFVVHLVRDPRGVTYSMSKTIRRPGVPWSEEYLSRRGPLQGSALWMLANLAAETLCSRADGYLRVRYTDFVRSPARTLSSILRMTGEDVDADRLAHVDGRTLSLGVQHILSGNPVRGRTGEIPLREDLEWRQEMESGRRRLVTSITLPFLLRYGFLGSDDGAERPTPGVEEADRRTEVARPEGSTRPRLEPGVAIGAPMDGTS